MLYAPMVQAGSVGNYQKSKLPKLYPQPKCQSHHCSQPVPKVGVQIKIMVNYQWYLVIMVYKM